MLVSLANLPLLAKFQLGHLRRSWSPWPSSIFGDAPPLISNLVRCPACLGECTRQLVHVVDLEEGAGAGLVEALDAAQLPADGAAAGKSEAKRS